jgi:hypothetical protein
VKPKIKKLIEYIKGIAPVYIIHDRNPVCKKNSGNNPNRIFLVFLILFCAQSILKK